jgi:hypothetical protein
MQLDSFQSRLWKCRRRSYVLRFCLFILPRNSRVLLPFGPDINSLLTVTLVSKLLSVSLWVKSTHTLNFYSRGTLCESRSNCRVFWAFRDFDQSPGNCRSYDLDRSLDVTELHIWQVPVSKLWTEMDITTHVSRDLKIQFLSYDQIFAITRANIQSLLRQFFTPPR